MLTPADFWRQSERSRRPPAPLDYFRRATEPTDSPRAAVGCYLKRIATGRPGRSAPLSQLRLVRVPETEADAAAA